ncbi:MAG: SDR family oxidoreductase [Vicinamibacteria bacterium]
MISSPLVSCARTDAASAAGASPRIVERGLIAFVWYRKGGVRLWIDGRGEIHRGALLYPREGIEEAWPEGVASFRARAPFGRLGRPEDVADACLFLASSRAGFITGANLVVDGGVLTAPAFWVRAPLMQR